MKEQPNIKGYDGNPLEAPDLSAALTVLTVPTIMRGQIFGLTQTTRPIGQLR